MPNVSDLLVSPSAFRSPYTVSVECICCLAFVANILLLIVYIACPLKTLACRYFLVLWFVQNLISTVSYFLLAPRAASFDWTFLLVSTGRGGDWTAGPFLMLTYSMTFVSSILLVANSFVNKYFQLCRPLESNIYASTKWLVLIGFINAAVIVNWLLMNVFCGWPSKQFTHYFRNMVLNFYNFDLLQATFMGISLYHGLTMFSFILLVEALVMMFLVGCVGLLCAVMIQLFISRMSMSNLTRTSHRQILTLLLIQTACPVFLLHIPMYTMYGLLFTGATSPHWLGITIGILMALFPLISPITIFAFIKDYRRFILSKLFWINCKVFGGMPKRSSKNVVHVKAGLTGSNKTEP
ncbi:hypothetical protein V3C99_013184 [Haemonchus contortus]